MTATTATINDRERLIDVEGAKLCVATFGDSRDPTILLVAGASASMLWWDAALCEQIASSGRFVVRYDHRDTGRSSCSSPGEPGYSYTDLALDALGVIDAVGVEHVHLVCQSMFGGIGSILAVDHPDRVASVTFVSCSTGEAGLPPPTAEVSTVLPPPNPVDSAAVVEYVVQSARVNAGGSPYFDEPAVRSLVERDVARARNYASTLVNHYLINVDQPAGGGFGKIAVPALVVHGDLDPVVPLPHGEALCDAVPGAELVVLHGAGHDVPSPVWDDFVSALVSHTGQGKS